MSFSIRASVVICGSYRRDTPGLRRLWRELELAGYRILSPLNIEFADTSQPVARLPCEASVSIDELERLHLRALCLADMVWLHAPDGHVGISTSYELGYAAALGKPVCTLNNLNDEMLASQVKSFASVCSADKTCRSLQDGSLD